MRLKNAAAEKAFGPSAPDTPRARSKYHEWVPKAPNARAQFRRLNVQQANRSEPTPSEKKRKQQLRGNKRNKPSFGCNYLNSRSKEELILTALARLFFPMGSSASRPSSANISRGPQVGAWNLNYFSFWGSLVRLARETKRTHGFGCGFQGKTQRKFVFCWKVSRETRRRFPIEIQGLPNLRPGVVPFNRSCPDPNPQPQA